MKTVIPATCPDFVEHPHLIDGRGCYTCQTSLASEEQGTSAIALELRALGVPCDVHQTGGFTMCVYIKTGDESYIYSNDEGFSFYCGEDCEGLNEFDFRDGMTPAKKALEIIEKMKSHNLTAREI